MATIIIWCAVALLAFAAVIYRYMSMHRSIAVRHRRHRIITFGSEREELFMPGDPCRFNKSYNEVEDD